MAVQKFPVPKTIKNVQNFLGLTGYFRKFITLFFDCKTIKRPDPKYGEVSNWSVGHTVVQQIEGKPLKTSNPTNLLARRTNGTPHRRMQIWNRFYFVPDFK